MITESEAVQESAPDLRSRRSFLAGVALFPLIAISDRASGFVESSNSQDKGKTPPPGGLSPKDRYLALTAGFAEAYNLRDLNRALSFFSESATLTVNGRTLKGRMAIRAFLVEYGAATEGASFVGARMMSVASYFTDDALLIDGRIVGRHQGMISGFEGTGGTRAIVFAAFYRFDNDGRCKSADITMNWGTFFGIA